MKKLIFIFSTLISISFFSCQNDGGVWLGEGDSYGKPFTFGTQTEIDNLQDLAKSYSDLELEKSFSYYADEFLTDRFKENQAKWADAMESLSMVPYKLIPLHQKDGDFKEVLAWSKEERIFKNGSYQKLDLMEQFVLDNAGKVKGFKQWVAIDSANYGFTYGGKFFGRKESEYTGRPFVFSNRNETKIIEEMVESYNRMDTEGMKMAFADEFVFNDYKGQKETYKKSDLANFFKPFRSVNWKLNAIIPIKIANTDAASGVIVRGTESRVFKNGRKWNKELMEIYYFDLEGKISSMEQFAK